MSACRRTRRCSSARRRRSSTCSFWKTRSRRRTSPTSGRSAQNCATPIAMGELFNSPHEWQPLISGRLIDYIRVPRFAGGRLHAGAQDCDPGRAVWREDGVARAGRCFADRAHGASHAGHVSYNFGIQEYSPFNETTQEMFQGLPGDEGRLSVGERDAGLGHRGRREGRRRSIRSQQGERSEWRMGRDPEAGRHRDQAVDCLQESGREGQVILPFFLLGWDMRCGQSER